MKRVTREYKEKLAVIGDGGGSDKTFNDERKEQKLTGDVNT